MGFFNRLFGGAKEEEIPPFSISQLKTDIHSHLIPGIDDGSQSMDQTIAMLAKFENIGYKKVITTPHIMSDSFPNTPEIILGGLEKVREEIQSLGLKIQIEAAAEYYFDETLLPKIKNKELLTFGDNYVLIEFGFHSPPQSVDQLFFDLQSSGYRVVIAHFERYMYYLGKVDQAIEWRQKGINIQLNLNSLTGNYGPGIKKQAEALIDNQAIDFVGTDCHRIEHLGLLEETIKTKYFHKLGQIPLKNTIL
jgi:tyrosine-protein phosphatase YwqE